MGDWLTILIILLILGILLDGWRRMRNAQKDSIKVSRSMRRSSATGGAKEARDDYNSAELPNGGARVVAYRETPEDERPFDGQPPADELDVDDTEQDGEWLDEAYDPDPDDDYEERPREEEPAPAESRRSSIPQQVTLNLDESVPILMETEEDDTYGRDDGRIEPSLGGGLDDEPEPARPTPPPKAPERPAPKPEPKRAQEPPKPSAPKPKAPDRAAAKPEPKPAPLPEEVLIINVMAPSGQQFRGDALLDALLDAGLRYGDMNIFHRYEDPKGGGAILFSLANMVKPGTFDLDGMDDFTTPGVSLFMTLPLESVDLENVEVFDEMLEAARSIAFELGGEMKDENRSVLTRQTQEHCRQRIHEFERKQLSRAH
ncbi:cell division protein ZipA [Marinimicrobium agarilyticum]|uniref:cell division protein ZipA n=1 Tax=Marinimicrobium agarilyticum TaxID=306546 RepID=UPI0003FD3162|nr:cell division protein ZipA [Marinimicrobium agarilyticum]